MILTCPHCGFSRDIEDEEIPAAPSRIRCQRCGGIFTAEQTPLPVDNGGTVRPPAVAGFWVRVVGALTDIILVAVVDIVGSLLFSTAIRLLAGDLGPHGDALRATITGVFGTVLVIAYYVFFTGYCGQTPGKMAIRVKVIRTDGSDIGYGRAFLREVIGKFLSWILLGIGYLMVAFDARKQGLHDKIADTYVIKI
jgi:predicted Zn finger-like uncharacterized protein